MVLPHYVDLGGILSPEIGVIFGKVFPKKYINSWIKPLPIVRLLMIGTLTKLLFCLKYFQITDLE